MFVESYAGGQLEKSHVIIMGNSDVVRRVRDDAPYLHLLPVIGMRVSSSYAQLDGPAGHIRMATQDVAAFFALLCIRKYLLSHAVRCCEHPLIGNEHTCAVEYFFRSTQKSGQEGPVARF